MLNKKIISTALVTSILFSVFVGCNTNKKEMKVKSNTEVKKEEIKTNKKDIKNTEDNKKENKKENKTTNSSGEITIVDKNGNKRIVKRRTTLTDNEKSKVSNITKDFITNSLSVNYKKDTLESRLNNSKKYLPKEIYTNSKYTNQIKNFIEENKTKEMMEKVKKVNILDMKFDKFNYYEIKYSGESEFKWNGNKKKEIGKFQGTMTISPEFKIINNNNFYTN